MSRRKAFTLFEVLMALGIFAIVVIGMMSALNAVLDASGEIRSAQRVRSQLANRLAALEADKPRELQRRVQVEDPKMMITETVRKENVVNDKKTVLSGFWRVVILVEWEDAGTKRQEEVSVLRYSR